METCGPSNSDEHCTLFVNIELITVVYSIIAKQIDFNQLDFSLGLILRVYQAPGNPNLKLKLTR